jgi:zinc transport system substrate-binding protein
MRVIRGKKIIGIAVFASALIAGIGIVHSASGQNLAGQQQLPPNNDTTKVRVIASFFPLYDYARNVGGDRADVSVMVPAGIEPHDWEPTPRDIADVQNADMIVINGAGFEGWVSDIDAKFIVDTSRNISLIEGSDEDHEHEEEGDRASNMTAAITTTNASISNTTTNNNATPPTNAEADVESVHEEESNLDPHIWLDPALAKKQVEAIWDGFVQVDPANSDYYSQNAQRYIAELDLLDSFIRSELSNCTLNDFIAFHDAFSYFANRYNLTQHSVHGISPEGDVLPQRIQEIKDLAASLAINVIYAEDLVDPRLANVIAGEIPGGQVLVLSPIEGLEREELENGLGYIDKMRENVEHLKVGLKCL